MAYLVAIDGTDASGKATQTALLAERLRKMGIKHLTVVFSKEEPIKTGVRTPGSTAFVPGSAGLLIASRIIRDLSEKNAFSPLTSKEK